MIALSKLESELTGMQVYRGIDYFDVFDGIELRKALIDNRADWCKVRLNGSDDSLFKKLDSTGLPYFISSAIYRNEINLRSNYSVKEIPANVTYELYDGSQQEELTTLLKAVAKEPLGIYYQNELIQHFLNDEIEDKINTAYILSFNQRADPSKSAWLLRCGGEPAGYFMGIEKGKTFEGTLYGIHPSFRGKKLAGVVYRAMLKICVELGFELFENGVHVLNPRSLSPTAKEGVLPKSMYFYVMLYPFISFTETNCQSALEATAENAMEKLLKNCSNAPKNLRWRFFDEKNQGEKIQIKISHPVRTGQNSTRIVVARNQKQEICGHGLIMT